MSDTTATASPGGAPKVSRINEAVIRIAGNSQDGIQAIGGFLARLAGRSEQEVMTFMTIPSTISGGPSIFQVRIGSGEVLSAGDEADVLLAFYQHSYEDHIGSLKKGGIVLYDSDHVEPKPEWQKDYHHVGVPISSLTIEAIGGTAKDKGKNIFALGLIARMFDLNVPKLEKLIGERFGGKDRERAEQRAGRLPRRLHSFARQRAGDVSSSSTARRKDGHQVVMNGNEALAYGLIAAGVRFGAAYPITPWSDVMEMLRRELPKYGGTFVQCEDEIASISMAIGASFAGRVAVTGSSGPGISLKMESLGWAVMAEVPLVIVDVQRGGPSTGLPTNVEQSDLNIACFGSHGDCAARRARAGQRRGLFLHRHRGGQHRAQIQRAGLHSERPGHRHAHRGLSRAGPGENLPGHFARPHAGARLQALRSVRPGRRDAARRARHAHPERQVSRSPPASSTTNSATRPARPKLHMQMTAKRRKKLQALGGHAADAEGLRPAGGQRAARRLGFDPRPDPRGRGPRPRRRRQRFRRCTSNISIRCRTGLENIFSGFHHVLVVEMNDEGLYGYGQLGRPAARPLLRPADPRHQQDRRPDLEGEGNPGGGETEIVIERPGRQSRLIFKVERCYERNR